MQFDALIKVQCKLQHLKTVTNWHQYTKTTEDKKFIFWINVHIPIEKQSNQEWKKPIHLESNGQHIKVPFIFWFLIMIFYFCFYHQLCVKSSFSTFVFITNCGHVEWSWMFDTDWNAHQVDILDNLIN